MQTQQSRAEYEISTDTHRLNVGVIHKFLAEDSYWSPGIPRSIVERAIENSLCFGVYHRAAQVGFARVVTDKSTFALLADVFRQLSWYHEGMPNPSIAQSESLNSVKPLFRPSVG